METAYSGLNHLAVTNATADPSALPQDDSALGRLNVSGLHLLEVCGRLFSMPLVPL